MTEQQTERIYDRDPYQRECIARVLSCHQEGEGYALVLDGTVFYPEGGGQPGDRGLLRVQGEQGACVQVKDTQQQEGEIRHLTEEPIEPGTQVLAQIDWRRRFDLMQNHTGEHIVSGLIHAAFGYDNVGFHMGSDFLTIDLSGPLSQEQLKEIEAAANQVVWEDRTVQVACYPSEEARALTYRSKKELTGVVRIVTIAGADVCACCGTHVQRTGEIGLIRLFDVQRFKGGARIRMLCGRRALAYLDEIYAQNHEISVLLSAKMPETARAVARLKEEHARLSYEALQAQQTRLQALAASCQGQRRSVLLIPPVAPEQMAHLAVAVMDQGEQTCFVFSGSDEEGYRYAGGENGADLREFVRTLNAALCGRGGGKPHFVQGAVKAQAREILAFFHEQGFWHNQSTGNQPSARELSGNG